MKQGMGRKKGGRRMRKEDEELQALLGKEYTPENAHALKYGGIVDSKGIIVRVITKRDEERRAKECAELKKSLSK